MKRLSVLCLFAAFVAVFPSTQWAVERVVLEGGVNFSEKLDENEVYFKWIKDFQVDPENNFVYFLDFSFSQILKVEFPTGKRIKTISRKGQGPAELYMPKSMAVRNNKIFVLNIGSNGIKIFDTDGNAVGEFRFLDFYCGSRNIVVNNKDEIFIGYPDPGNNTMVSVFDIEGNKLRSLVPIEGGEEAIKKYTKSRDQFILEMDDQGNLYLLFYMLRKLAKYNPQGKRLWEVDIKNELLDSFPNQDFIRKEKNGTIRSRDSVYDVEALKDGRVFVGHACGGCIFQKDGQLEKVYQKKMITTEKYAYNATFRKVRVKGNIFFVYFHQDFYYFKL